MKVSRQVLAGFGITALAIGCDPAPQSGERPLLRIASDATFTPFHFVDDSGVATGFDLELARLVAKRAGFDPEVAVIPYDDLFVGLTNGSHDLVAATTGVTEERERRYLFTTPYFRTGQAVLVRRGEDEPASLIALKGRRVGAAGAGTSALAQRRLAESERVSLGKGQAGVPALLDGTIDALIVDEYDAVVAARASDGRLGVLPEPVALESYAFVLAAGQDGLKSTLDRALEELENEGVIDELLRRFAMVRDEEWPLRLDRYQPQSVTPLNLPR